MAWDEEDDTRQWRVVLYEDSKVHSIVPGGRRPPRGWKDAGFAGTKEECLGHIRKVWADMRALSLREIEAKLQPLE